ncbi:hypothetical protein Goarm_010991 [Gossypium armourianum]|uniref:Uncharacterized protein n=1 Tax=Gossypium armourianum TaxID=34283 RepID=A0A7J9IY34_9ROSI|nr:hypothetical protein [Gossypium armourianum]
MGHGVKECSNIPIAEREKIDDEYSYSLALKVESNLIGKESFQFGFSAKRIMKQCLYTGVATVDREEIMPNNLPESKHREGEQIGSEKEVEVLHGLEETKMVDLCMIDKVLRKPNNCLEHMEDSDKSNFDENDNK